MFITLAGRWSAAGRPASGLRLSRLRRRMVERVELFDSLGRGRLTRADRDIAGHPELTARGGAVAGGEERVAGFIESSRFTNIFVVIAIAGSNPPLVAKRRRGAVFFAIASA